MSDVHCVRSTHWRADVVVVVVGSGCIWLAFFVPAFVVVHGLVDCQDTLCCASGVWMDGLDTRRVAGVMHVCHCMCSERLEVIIGPRYPYCTVLLQHRLRICGHNRRVKTMFARSRYMICSKTTKLLLEVIVGTHHAQFYPHFLHFCCILGIQGKRGAETELE